MAKTKVYLALFFLIAFILLGFLMIFVSNFERKSPEPLTQPNWSELQKDESLLAYGELQYKIRCSKCHGMSGQGFSNGVALNDDEWIFGNGDYDSIYSVVYYGIPGTEMKGWGKKLRSKDIESVVLFVKTLSTTE